MIHQFTTSKPDTNKQLVQLIKQLQQRSKTEMYGTWTSPKTLFRSDHPAIKELVDEISLHLEDVTALPITEWELNGWANILADENKMSPHNHQFHDRNANPPIMNEWAGVYYVDSPGGTISFVDASQIESEDRGHITLREGHKAEEIETKAGLLLIFGALDVHYVKPHRKPERERISIAFNVRKAPKEEIS